MTAPDALDLEWASRDNSRYEMWSQFINDQGIKRVAEIGVFRGEFAGAILDACPGVATYHLLDPWRFLDDWNKPANLGNDDLEACYQTALQRTEAHSDRRVVLRGTTAERIDEIDDASLDLAYVDADHTLRGITIDLMKVWPKVRDGGFLGGDDFTRSMWQHDDKFEPSMVFPLAVYFAEAVDAPIYALPHRQFLIHKVRGHRFVDTTGRFTEATVLHAMKPRRQKAAPAAAAAPPKPAPAPPSTARRVLRRLRRMV